MAINNHHGGGGGGEVATLLGALCEMNCGLRATLLTMAQYFDSCLLSEFTWIPVILSIKSVHCF